MDSYLIRNFFSQMMSASRKRQVRGNSGLVRCAAIHERTETHASTRCSTRKWR